MIAIQQLETLILQKLNGHGKTFTDKSFSKINPDEMFINVQLENGQKVNKPQLSYTNNLTQFNRNESGVYETPVEINVYVPYGVNRLDKFKTARALLETIKEEEFTKKKNIDGGNTFFFADGLLEDTQVREGSYTILQFQFTVKAIESVQQVKLLPITNNVLFNYNDEDKVYINDNTERQKFLESVLHFSASNFIDNLDNAPEYFDFFGGNVEEFVTLDVADYIGALGSVSNLLTRNYLIATTDIDSGNLNYFKSNYDFYFIVTTTQISDSKVQFGLVKDVIASNSPFIDGEREMFVERGHTRRRISNVATVFDFAEDSLLQQTEDINRGFLATRTTQQFDIEFDGLDDDYNKFLKDESWAVYLETVGTRDLVDSGGLPIGGLEKTTSTTALIALPPQDKEEQFAMFFNPFKYAPVSDDEIGRNSYESLNTFIKYLDPSVVPDPVLTPSDNKLNLKISSLPVFSVNQLQLNPILDVDEFIIDWKLVVVGGADIINFTYVIPPVETPDVAVLNLEEANTSSPNTTKEYVTEFVPVTTDMLNTQFWNWNNEPKIYEYPTNFFGISTPNRETYPLPSKKFDKNTQWDIYTEIMPEIIKHRFEDKNSYLKDTARQEDLDFTVLENYNIPLLDEKYADYIAENYNSAHTTLAVQQQAQRETLIGGAITGAVGGAIAGTIVPGIGNIAGAVVGAIVGGGGTLLSGITSQSSSFAAQKKLLLLQEENIQNSPPQFRYGDFAQDTRTMNGNLRPIIVQKQLKESENIKLAKFFHQFGYTVSELIQAKRIIDNRQYFNYVETRDIENAITFDINNQEMEIIKNYASNGMRLWYIRDTFRGIGNYDYDNTETNYN